MTSSGGQTQAFPGPGEEFFHHTTLQETSSIRKLYIGVPKPHVENIITTPLPQLHNHHLKAGNTSLIPWESA
jgi:hypothetical protein